MPLWREVVIAVVAAGLVAVLGHLCARALHWIEHRFTRNTIIPPKPEPLINPSPSEGIIGGINAATNSYWNARPSAAASLQNIAGILGTSAQALQQARQDSSVLVQSGHAGQLEALRRILDAGHSGGTKAS